MTGEIRMYEEFVISRGVVFTKKSPLKSVKTLLKNVIGIDTRVDERIVSSLN